jgi:Baseplate J-like protein
VSAFFCCDPRRREAVRASPLNGIDFLDVVDADAATPADRQRVLRVHFLKAPAPAGIGVANVAVEGGDRIKGIVPDRVGYDGDVLVVHLSAYGDYSRYTLRLVAAPGSAFDATRIDPKLGAVDFSFKVECPSDFDCGTPPQCTPADLPAPAIDYLAKDFSSFRQLMLDRMAAVSPGWTERNAADLGISLVEVLAYVADALSYRQDAIATEAYLGTARRRVSVRRHARLVDYAMHDGVNARTFVHVEAAADTLVSAGTRVLSAVPGVGPRIAPGSADLVQALSRGPEVFETLHDLRAFAAHNRLVFHTWGDGRCCLPRGATGATLRGRFPQLAAGDVLVFEEVLGPRTGLAADADPAHRCAVRLTSVVASSDPIGGMFLDPPTGQPLDVTEIAWAAADALPFPLCLSAEVTAGGTTREVVDVSVAVGNIVLADHGRTIDPEPLGTVPAPTLFREAAAHAGACTATAPVPIPPRFRPRLKNRPIVFSVAYDPGAPPPSALEALRVSPAEAVASVRLSGTSGSATNLPWTPLRDLLRSDATDDVFVVETESDGSASLRFGDDTHGRRPPAGTTFAATYRIGDAARGNVGADTLVHLVGADPAVRGVRNPLPAVGAVAPETIEHVRQSAPFGFRAQRRAVTADDYRALAESHPGVQRAAVAFRWTGSWTTVFVTVDRTGGAEVDAAFEADMRRFLEPFRMAGHDVDIDGPRYVALEIEMQIVAAADHFREDVLAALRSTFGSGSLPDGRRAVFHPDNFTFGQPVYSSPLFAAAQAVDGVLSARIVKFRRLGRPDSDAVATGRLDIARGEIARLDNDPDFPDRGVFRVTVGGGK